MATESEDREWRDPNNWKGGRYTAPDDPRVIVPKRNPMLGWTVNFGQREGRRIVTATFVTYGSVAAAIAIAFLAARWLSH
jgi:uncharacterized membrane protein